MLVFCRPLPFPLVLEPEEAPPRKTQFALQCLLPPVGYRLASEETSVTTSLRGEGACPPCGDQPVQGSSGGAGGWTEQDTEAEHQQ
jgi:hypothetical protein